MKTVLSIILLIFFIPLTIVLVVLATLKFSLLQPAFWQHTFGKYNTYTKLSNYVKTVAEEQNIKVGGNNEDIKVITNIITPLNVKDVVDKNFTNILNYTNGLSKELFVYIPYKLIPNGLLPKNFDQTPEQVPIASFLANFNINFVTLDQIQQLSKVGYLLTYSIVLSVFLLLMLFVLLILLTVEGKNFLGPGLAFIFPSIILSPLGYLLLNFKTNNQLILSLIALPAMSEIGRWWLIISGLLLVSGVVLLFVKKPT